MKRINRPYNSRRLRRLRLSVKPVQDREFRNSSESYKIERELRRTLERFEKQFPVWFEFLPVGRWQSPGSSTLQDYPVNFARQFPKRPRSKQELVDGALKVVRREYRIPIRLTAKEKRKLAAGIKQKTIRARNRYLARQIEDEIIGHLTEDLKKRYEKSADVILGFTAKIGNNENIFITERNWEGCTDNSCATIGLNKKPSYIIGHELGHIFGAEHVSAKRSIMHRSTDRAYRFDRKNQKLILKRLAEIAKTKRRRRKK